MRTVSPAASPFTWVTPISSSFPWMAPEAAISSSMVSGGDHDERYSGGADLELLPVDGAGGGDLELGDAGRPCREGDTSRELAHLDDVGLEFVGLELRDIGQLHPGDVAGLELAGPAYSLGGLPTPASSTPATSPASRRLYANRGMLSSAAAFAAARSPRRS